MRYSATIALSLMLLGLCSIPPHSVPSCNLLQGIDKVNTSAEVISKTTLVLKVEGFPAILTSRI
jgi:hypothetical protein